MGHLRKLGTKTHFAKLTHILTLKKAWACCYKGIFLLSPSPPSSVDCVNAAPGGRGDGRCLNLTSYCVSVPRILTRVVVLILQVNKEIFCTRYTMNLLYESNSLCMKGVTNKWEIQNVVAINLTFFSDTRKKNIIQISCKSRSFIVLRKMCKNSELILVAQYRLRNFYSNIVICRVILIKHEIMKLLAYSYETK